MSNRSAYWRAYSLRRRQRPGYREYQRKYELRSYARHKDDPARKAQNAEAQRLARQREDLRIRYAARRTLRLAVDAGRVTKQPCAACQNPKSQAHHPDYTKPLEVVWLCRKCHSAMHRKYRQATGEVEA